MTTLSWMFMYLHIRHGIFQQFTSAEINLNLVTSRETTTPSGPAPTALLPMKPILKSPEQLLFPTKPMLCVPTAIWQPIHVHSFRTQGCPNKRNCVMPRLEICDSGCERIRVKICVFLPTVGEERTNLHPKLCLGPKMTSL